MLLSCCVKRVALRSVPWSRRKLTEPTTHMMWRVPAAEWAAGRHSYYSVALKAGPSAHKHSGGSAHSAREHTGTGLRLPPSALSAVGQSCWSFSNQRQYPSFCEPAQRAFSGALAIKDEQRDVRLHERLRAHAGEPLRGRLSASRRRTAREQASAPSAPSHAAKAATAAAAAAPQSSVAQLLPFSTGRGSMCVH